MYYIMKFSYGEDDIPSRVCGYQLNFNFEIDDHVYFISGSFDEAGIDGLRVAGALCQIFNRSCWRVDMYLLGHASTLLQLIVWSQVVHDVQFSCEN